MPQPDIDFVNDQAVSWRADETPGWNRIDLASSIVPTRWAEDPRLLSVSLGDCEFEIGDLRWTAHDAGSAAASPLHGTLRDLHGSGFYRLELLSLAGDDAQAVSFGGPQAIDCGDEMVHALLVRTPPCKAIWIIADYNKPASC